MAPSERQRLDRDDPLVVELLAAQPRLAAALEQDPSLWDQVEEICAELLTRKSLQLQEGAMLGRWRIAGVLGRGRQGATVYAAAGAPGPGGLPAKEAAIKFPVQQHEFRCFSLAQQVRGVPEILDSGETERGTFVAMPILWACLAQVLQRLDHDGLGGRMSWDAAKSLGRMLVKTLQGIHARGVVHCDVKPENVMLRHGEGVTPYLVDFGRARRTDPSLGDGVNGIVGAMEFNSIRAGRGVAALSPADDLECVGWLMLRCVVGYLPWRRRIAQFKRGNVPREAFGEHISREKEEYLEAGCMQRNSRYRYCPQELKDFLLRVHGLGESEPDYSSLLELLSAGSSGAWERIVTDLERRGDSFAPNVHVAVRGEVRWRPQRSFTADQEASAAVPQGQHIRVTGRERRCEAGGQWLEVERVWAPELPTALLDQSWIRIADDRGALLVPWEREESAGKPEAPGDFCLVGSWDSWANFLPFQPPAAGTFLYSATVELDRCSGPVEFQVVQDRDWSCRFYPRYHGNDFEVCGPADADGINFQVHPPRECERLHVSWDPRGRRRLEWRFS